MPARLVCKMKAKAEATYCGTFVTALMLDVWVKVASDDVETSVEEDVLVPKKGNKSLLLT